MSSNTGVARRSGKKNRKHSRNKVFCTRYKAENRRVKNKIKKLNRHLEKFSDDEQATKALKKLK